MASPINKDAAQYIPIEINSDSDFGPHKFFWGTIQEDSNGDPVYNTETGDPEIDYYDLTGYSFEAPITSTTSISGSTAFTVGTVGISGGELSLSLTDAQANLIKSWTVTDKPTECVAEYRVSFILGTVKKVKQYGKISINTIGD